MGEKRIMPSREGFLNPFPVAQRPFEAKPTPEVRQHGVGVDPTAPLSALSQLVRSFFLFFLSGASIGAALAFVSYEHLPELVSNNNTISAADRRAILSYIVIAGIFACLLPCAYLLQKRSQQAVDLVARAGRVISPLMLVFVLPFLFDWHVFQGHELSCALTGAVFGIALEHCLRVSFSALRCPAAVQLWSETCRHNPRLVRWVPGVLIGTMAVFFAVYFSHYTLLHHYRLQTQSLDLAVYDNEFWNLLRGKWFKISPSLGRTGTHMAYHAEFVAYLLAPFYALRQKASTLLIMQAVLCGAGAIPIFLIARRRLDSAVAGLAFAYAYIVYGPLHGPIFYDFHFLTLAPFFVGWVLYFFESGRRGLLIAAWFAAALLREDQSAGLAMAGLFYLVSGDRPRWALGGAVLSAVFFVVMKFIVMPAHSEGSEAFAWIFAGLIPSGEQGFGAALRSVFSNPVFALNTILVPDKFVYVMKILAPVLLLPFRHARTWLLLVPAALFTLLSTGYQPVVQTSFQYTSYWTAYLFVAGAIVLASWKHRPDGKPRIAAALAAMVVTSTAMSYNHGAIFQHNTFQGGFRHVVFDKSVEDIKNHNDFYALVAMIPPKVSVTATETEAAHVSSREDCFTMRMGYQDADYLLLSIAEARGGESRDAMVAALATSNYGLVDSRGNFQLWRKGYSQARNSEGKRQLGIP